MKFVEQKVELFYEPNPFLKVERAGRTCYQSMKDDGTVQTAKEFCQRALSAHHYSIFEHLILTFVFEDKGLFGEYSNYLSKAKTHPNFSSSNCFISINFRFLMEAFYSYGNNDNPLNLLVFKVYKLYPDLFLENPINEYDCRIEMNGDRVLVMTNEDFISWHGDRLSQEEIQNHIYFSFIISTDRGVMAELTRHRLNAFSVSSTRYLNFEKKYKGIPFVRPVDRDFTEEEMTLLTAIEDAYVNSLEHGLVPQRARAILPNCLWTEIFTTANLKQWGHVYELRSSSRAHPQIRDIAERMKIALEKEGFYLNEESGLFSFQHFQ